MEEVWRPFNNYEANTAGIVRNPRTGQVLRPIKKRGYLYVNLYKDGVLKSYLVHRLVGMTFPDLVGWTEDAKGRPFEELEINHKDENKENNCVENLEWCNGKYNQTYSNGKAVYQCTPDGELVKVWPSTRECGRNGFNASHVAECCRGEHKTHKGFRWSYNPPQ